MSGQAELQASSEAAPVICMYDTEPASYTHPRPRKPAAIAIALSNYTSWRAWRTRPAPGPIFPYMATQVLQNVSMDLRTSASGFMYLPILRYSMILPKMIYSWKRGEVVQGIDPTVDRKMTCFAGCPS